MFSGISQYEVTHMENLMVRDDYWNDDPVDVRTLCDICECSDCPRYGDDCDGMGTTMTTASTKAAPPIMKSKETNMSTMMKTSARYTENPHKKKSTPEGAPLAQLKSTPPGTKLQGGK